MKTITLKTIVALVGASVLLSYCKKDEEVETITNITGYTVPTSYEFTRDNETSVDFDGQITRLDMFDELSDYLKTGNDGDVLTTQKMLDIFRNENNPFTDAELNASTKSMSSKTYADDVTLLEQYFANAQAASEFGDNTAASGQAGISYKADNSSGYLVDANGVEWTQVILKRLMGALLYYQSTSKYLEEGKIGNTVNNTDVVDGKNYTVMEHHFDEAFGYFGASVEFPTVTEGARYYAKYTNKRDGALSVNSTLMNAFLKGRAAIANKDMAAKDEAIIVIKQQWELVVVGSAIHYLNEAIGNFSDDAIRSHTLSECLGFVASLRYNLDKSISEADISSVESDLGTNFYEISIEDLNNAKSTLVTSFGLEAQADNL